MNKLIAIVMAASFFVSVHAHSPAEVKADFNVGTKVLNVKYAHSVKDPASHFISTVTVDLNGKEIISQKLLKQDDMKYGSVLYKIPEAKAGDKIVVKTKCNKGGGKNFELTVEKILEPSVKEVKKAVPENQIPQKDIPKQEAPETLTR
ncbi:MAG: hypothetical protein JXN63_02355 [Candidatus Delongbacteria bacterium]|nr:hypothetical protein [Candidatus Delongbacteria bacterium]